MPASDYTDKQMADHLEQFAKDGTLPDGSAFRPAAFARGEPILRKLTTEERRDAGLPAASAEKTPADDAKG